MRSTHVALCRATGEIFSFLYEFVFLHLWFFLQFTSALGEKMGRRCKEVRPACSFKSTEAPSMEIFIGLLLSQSVGNFSWMLVVLFLKKTGGNYSESSVFAIISNWLLAMQHLYTHYKVQGWYIGYARKTHTKVSWRIVRPLKKVF